jgi:hypothetical protein
MYYTPNKHPSKVDSIFLSKSTDAEWIKIIHTLKYYYEISVVVLTEKLKRVFWNGSFGLTQARF